MPAPRSPDTDPTLLGTMPRRLRRIDMIWPALVVLVIAASLVSDNFLTVNNLLNILRHATIVGLLAVGVTVVLIGGNFDLSVGAIVTMAAVLSIEIGPVDGPLTALAIVLPLVMATLIGGVNGAIVGGLRANSIVVTVGMQFLIIGLVLALVSGQHVRVDGATDFYVDIANGYLLGIPVPVYLLAIAVVAAQFILRETAFGRHVHAVGGNENAARLAGIRTREVIVATYMMSGFLAGVTGVLVGSRVRNLDPTAGIGYEFAALTAVVLGGARLTGGDARVLSTLAAVLVLGVLTNLMILSNVRYSTQLLVQGAVLLAAVLVSTYVRGLRE